MLHKLLIIINKVKNERYKDTKEKINSHIIHY